MANANLIIYATPVYLFGMTGLATSGGSMVRMMFLDTNSSLIAQDHGEENLV